MTLIRPFFASETSIIRFCDVRSCFIHQINYIELMEIAI